MLVTSADTHTHIIFAGANNKIFFLIQLATNIFILITTFRLSSQFILSLLFTVVFT